VNTGFEYRAIVGRLDAGRTLIDHLALRFRHSSRDEWRERIACGRVLIDGCAAAATAILSAGQTVAWRRPPWEEPAAPLAWALLYRDSDLLAAAKPAGLPTLAGGGFLAGTLGALVRRLHPEAAPVHRLDRGASGIVLFARSARARARLAHAFRHGEVEKEYRALVHGEAPAAPFAITAPIGRVSHPVLGSIHAAAAESDADPRAGRAARSEVQVVERRGASTLLAVRPVTGRPHQIRIHLAAAGLPLVGEPLYLPGGAPRPDAVAAGACGYLLHALRVEFDHPVHGGRVQVECAPPPALRRLSVR
jgi:23S rRNA pseudouridine1911/1915/1917 synthase